MIQLPPIVQLLVAGLAAASSSTSSSSTSSSSTESRADPVDRDEDSEEVVELRKRGIPRPPTQDRAAYQRWRRGLPKRIQRKIARHCRAHGGDFQEVCNGIGPHAIPVPPSRVRMPVRDPDGNVLGLTHEQWQASLSPVQARYFDDYCDGSEDTGYSELCGGTPLVLAFHDEPIAYTSGGRFALSAGDPIATDWPTATTPWLALDRDGDGAISNGSELFGATTMLPDGTFAPHGFAALAALDDNHDGRLDRDDPAFAALLVWADRDGDRASTPAELTRLSEVVVSISLGYHRAPRCDDRGNCEGERAAMTWRDASGAVQTGSVVDVYLRFR